MNKRIWVALFLVVASITSMAQELTYKGVKPAVIIDVRTPQEFAAGHIAGAINIPFDQIGEGIKSVKGLGKDQPVLVYCRTGRRSEIARDTLLQQGYKQVFDGGAIGDVARTLNTCTPQIC